jgi:hypothetical protein
MHETIFVSIASYRDTACSKTVASIFKQAKYPRRVFLGICTQNKDGELAEIPVIPDEYKSQTSIIKLDYTEAKGPTYARYLASTLHNNETYYLQIDSHSTFVANWDEKCIKMIQDIKRSNLSQKPVLSYYPMAHTENKPDASPTTTTRICHAFFNDRDILSFGGAAILDTNGEYTPVPFIAGGFHFSDASFLKELPYDPTLDYLFVGEEILQSIRFYTHGYDVFSPSENILYHEYTREESPKIWTDKNYKDDDAVKKVKDIIYNGNDDYGRYGLGKVRSLQDFFTFAGIDLDNRKITKNFCGQELPLEETSNSFKYITITITITIVILLLLILFTQSNGTYNL